MWKNDENNNENYKQTNFFLIRSVLSESAPNTNDEQTDCKIFRESVVKQ